MRKVWITESVLCSAPLPRSQDRTWDRAFLRRSVSPGSIASLPNATIAAMGKSKPVKRLNRYRDQIPNRIVECGAVYPPGCNLESTKASWDKLVEIVTRQGKGKSTRGKECPVKLRSVPPRRRRLGSLAGRRASAPRPGPLPHWEDDLSLLERLMEIVRSELPPDCQSTARITPAKVRVSMDVPYPFSRLTYSQKLVKMFRPQDARCPCHGAP